jgi:hypothetical protein
MLAANHGGPIVNQISTILQKKNLALPYNNYSIVLAVSSNRLHNQFSDYKHKQPSQ